MNEIRIIPVTGIPEVRPGDDVGGLLARALKAIDVLDDDVIVVTQKVVSKAEGRLRPASEKQDAIASESVRILRKTSGVTITETRHGFVCANAGVDSSNVEGDDIVLLPLDPDASARRIRARIRRVTGADVAVVVSDTFGRAWRVGQTDVAIGVAGIDPFVDYRGTTDMQGRTLFATRICIADELAGAAEMLMGKSNGVCAVVVRGVAARRARSSARAIVRAPQEDLFR